MDWTEKDITVAEGVRLHCYRTGSGSPVLLAHGATDNGRCWDRLAAVLARDYEVITFDARHHGKSDAPAAGPIGGGEDVLGVISNLRLRRPALIGHSMGARSVSRALAASPSAARCAVLEDPPWWAAPPDATRTRPNWSAMTVEEIAAAGREENPSWHEDEFAAWAESKTQFRPTDDWMKGVPSMAANWQTVAKLIETPTLLACGEPARGAIVTPETAAEAQSLSPAIEVATFPTGHNIRREAFEAFSNAVVDFLSRHP